MAFNPPNPGTFQTTISTVVTNLRNNFGDIVNLNNYITSEGGASFLETIIGLSDTDAAACVAAMGNLAALAAIYNGGAPGATLDYYANSQPLWGGL